MKDLNQMMENLAILMDQPYRKKDIHPTTKRLERVMNELYGKDRIQTKESLERSMNKSYDKDRIQTKESLENLVKYLIMNKRYDRYDISLFKRLINLDNVKLSELRELRDWDVFYREALIYYLYYMSVNNLSEMKLAGYNDILIKQNFRLGDYYNKSYEGHAEYEGHYLNATALHGEKNRSFRLFDLTMEPDSDRIDITLYNLKVDEKARERQIDLCELAIRSPKLEGEWSLYESNRLHALKSRKDFYPSKIIEYQKAFADSFLKLFGVSEVELINPSYIKIVPDGMAYVQAVQGGPEVCIIHNEKEIEKYEYQNDDYGKTIAKNFPNDENAVVVLKKQIEYY